MSRSVTNSGLSKMHFFLTPSGSSWAAFPYPKWCNSRIGGYSTAIRKAKIPLSAPVTIDSFAKLTLRLTSTIFISTRIENRTPTMISTGFFTRRRSIAVVTGFSCAPTVIAASGNVRVPASK